MAFLPLAIKDSGVVAEDRQTHPVGDLKLRKNIRKVRLDSCR